MAGTDGAKLVIRDCSGQPTQQWRPATRIGREGSLVTTAGAKCLSVPAGNPAATTVNAANCDGTIGQAWAVNGDGTVHALGKSLSVNGGATAANTVVGFAPYAGTRSQQWTITAAGSVVNPVSGRCLTPRRPRRGQC